MLNINNNTSQIKREILVSIAKLQLADDLKKGAHYIPRHMAKKGSAPMLCCIFHDREILRHRVVAALGHSVENIDDDKTLSHFVKEALERERPTFPMLTVIDEACNACVRSHYLVTNGCQACLARPCMVNCPKKCISIQKGRAHIDEETCINCGICLNNCPYHAIIKIPVPCEEACPVDAISKNEHGKEIIDYHKCIFCGNCMRECPFGAMLDKSQLVDVIKHIKNQKQVVALYAPAIAAQFKANYTQFEQALKTAGFTEVIEVAFGADITADKEAHEFEERMEKGDTLMTTSCCPAYVRAVKKHVPKLNACVSDTRSPMHYTAQQAKKQFPNSITVFVGPCLAKRKEGMDDEFVDYVLSIEEIGALFIAKEIDVAKMENVQKTKKPTATGRNFASSGGVAEAVRIRLKNPEKLKPFVIDGLDKAGLKKLAEFGSIQAGEMPITNETPNLVEVMCCAGGCIAGPSVITNPKVASVFLKKYAEDAL